MHVSYDLREDVKPQEVCFVRKTKFFRESEDFAENRETGNFPGDTAK